MSLMIELPETAVMRPTTATVSTIIANLYISLEQNGISIDQIYNIFTTLNQRMAALGFKNVSISVALEGEQVKVIVVKD